jgi:hypothetical protein
MHAASVLAANSVLRSLFSTVWRIPRRLLDAADHLDAYEACGAVWAGQSVRGRRRARMRQRRARMRLTASLDRRARRLPGGAGGSGARSITDRLLTPVVRRCLAALVGVHLELGEYPHCLAQRYSAHRRQTGRDTASRHTQPRSRVQSALSTNSCTHDVSYSALTYVHPCAYASPANADEPIQGSARHSPPCPLLLGFAGTLAPRFALVIHTAPASRLPT